MNSIIECPVGTLSPEASTHISQCTCRNEMVCELQETLKIVIYKQDVMLLDDCILMLKREISSMRNHSESSIVISIL